MMRPVIMAIVLVSVAGAGAHAVEPQEQRRRDNELTPLASLNCKDPQQEQRLKDTLAQQPAGTLRRAEILVLYAKCLLETKHRTPEAVPLLEEALAILPNNAGIYRHIGLAHLQSGQDLKAIDAFEQALRLAPDAHTHSRLGFAYLRSVSGPLSLSNPEAYKEGLIRSEHHFRQALALSPDTPQSHSDLGINLMMQKRFAEAIAEIEQAINLTPSFKGWRSDQEQAFALADFYATLGQAYWASGRTAEAEHMIKMGIEKAPNERARQHLELLGDITMRRVPPSKRQEAIRAFEDAGQKKIFDPFDQEVPHEQ